MISELFIQLGMIVSRTMKTSLMSYGPGHMRSVVGCLIVAVERDAFFYLLMWRVLTSGWNAAKLMDPVNTIHTASLRLFKFDARIK